MNYSNTLAGAAGLAAALSISSFASPALAHHAAGPGNSSVAGPVNTISAETFEEGDLVASATIDQTDFDELSDALLAEAAEAAAASGDEHAHFHSLDAIRTSALALSYGLTDDLMITARLPYVAREGIREGHAHEEAPGVFHGEVHDLGDSDGWGDMALLAQWRVLRDEGTHAEAAALFGVEAPTGDSDVTDNEGEPFDAEFQPGSDSWDFFLGFAASHREGRWALDGSGLYTFAGDGLDANLGDRFNYGVAASYRVLGAPAHHHDADGPAHSHGPSLDLVLELNGEWHDEQEEDGEIDPNSGGQVLFAAPGVRVTLNALSTFVSVGAPVISDLNGMQSEPHVRAAAGLAYRF